MRRVLIICIILAFIYFGGVLVFWGRFSTRTFVNGESVTLKTPSDVSMEMIAKTGAKSFIFCFSDEDLKEVSFDTLGIYHPAELDFADEEVSSSWAWPVNLFKKQDYIVSDDVSYDFDILSNYLLSLGFTDTDSVADSIYEKDGEWYFLPGGFNFGILCENVAKTIKNKERFFDFSKDYEMPECASYDGRILDYIIVDIDSQNLCFYKNGEQILNVPVVTGLESDETRNTPTGVWWSSDIYTDYTMTGDYGSSFVHYFMKITEDGVGIHDATWRDEFGGEIYKTDGSHGCINVSLDDMIEIYDEIISLNYNIPIIIKNNP